MVALGNYRPHAKWLLVVCGIVLVGCKDAEERYDVGYSDGYAVGYNTACQIRVTLIEGDFDNVDYARGYARGQTAGIMACNDDKAAGRR
jgi:hypothetical protein